MAGVCLRRPGRLPFRCAQRSKRAMTRFRIRPVAALIGVTLVAHAHLIHGQVVNGTVLGTVKDPAGAVMAAVNISAKSLDTGAVRSATTDRSGTYQILSMPPGTYQVEAAATGFQTSIRDHVTVTVGAAVTVNFELALGEVRQEVTVSSEAPQVNMTDASLGGLVGEREVRELPLNGRDWLQLTTLEAGVKGGIGQQSAASFSNSRAARGNGVALVISGNRPTGNVFLVDGLVVNDQAKGSPGSGLNVNLGGEAIREFRVFTDEYTAEHGRSTGGVVTAIFKSGTNEFHGNAYEFLRNSALDARNFFDSCPTTEPNCKDGGRPPFRRNQFGASAGGPIKKGKTFIFGDFEALRQSKGITHNTVTLSPNALKGSIIPIAPSVRPYLGFFAPANQSISPDGLSGIYHFVGTRIGKEVYTV